MNKVLKAIKDLNFCEWILFAVLAAIGGFNEFVACFASVALSVCLIIKTAKNRCLKINLNLNFIAVAALVLGYLFSTFYALDSGMAFIGFLKFLPALLFLLLAMQYDDGRKNMIAKLPYAALILGALSFVLMFIPALKDIFTVADRMSGFFQYPNTFAMFLLVGELVILCKQKLRAHEIIIAVILLVFLLFTGSRTVFALAVACNALILFFRKGKRIKIIVLVAAAVFVIGFILLVPLLKQNDLLARYLSFSLSEGTFAGRLLYYFDALPLILKNPFGLGYMGYSYIHQSVQSGVYSVMYIHNDILQIMLDVGWVPCLLFVAAIVKSIFSRKNQAGYKIILTALFLHLLFDFDLQFISMFFILILFLDYDSGKEILIKKNYGISVFVTIVFGLLSVYFGLALGFSYINLYDASDAMYPLNTNNKISMLIGSESIEQQNKTADEILSHNEYVHIALSAKARYAYSQGDFESLMRYKWKIFEVSPFSYDEYEEYCYMLIQGIYMYERVGDAQSADYCRQELIKTVKKTDKLDDRLSYFGKIIVDQPKTELPKEITDYITTLKMSSAFSAVD